MSLHLQSGSCKSISSVINSGSVAMSSAMYFYHFYILFAMEFIICSRAMARMGVFVSPILPSSTQLDQGHWITPRAQILISHHLLHTISLPLSLWTSGRVLTRGSLDLP